MICETEPPLDRYGMERQAEALAVFQAVRELLEPLASGLPGKAEDQKCLAIVYSNLGVVLEKQSKLADAEAEQRGLWILSSLRDELTTSCACSMTGLVRRASAGPSSGSPTASGNSSKNAPIHLASPDSRGLTAMHFAGEPASAPSCRPTVAGTHGPQQ